MLPPVSQGPDGPRPVFCPRAPNEGAQRCNGGVSEKTLAAVSEPLVAQIPSQTKECRDSPIGRGEVLQPSAMEVLIDKFLATLSLRGFLLWA